MPFEVPGDGGNAESRCESATALAVNVDKKDVHGNQSETGMTLAVPVQYAFLFSQGDLVGALLRHSRWQVVRHYRFSATDAGTYVRVLSCSQGRPKLLDAATVNRLHEAILEHVVKQQVVKGWANRECSIEPDKHVCVWKGRH